MFASSVPDSDASSLWVTFFSFMIRLRFCSSFTASSLSVSWLLIENAEPVARLCPC